MSFCQSTDRGILIHVRVQPRASSTGIAGLLDNALKVRVTSPPVEGEANRLLVKFLARKLGLPPSSLEILRGDASRTKQVLVREPDPQARARILETLLSLVSKP